MKKLIIESQFLYKYDEPEKGVTVGGTQRYAYEIGRMFKDLGWEIIYLTKACKYFEGEFEGIGRIIAFECPRGTGGTFKFSKKVFEYSTNEKADLVCYSDITVAYVQCYKKSFALQHGISWDNPMYGLKTLIHKYMYLKAANKFDKIICVDTNFINWMREHSKKYFQHPESLVYVPNFADEELFTYVYKEWEENEKFALLYPRRFVKHRGYDIFLDTCYKLYKHGYNIEVVIACEDFKRTQFDKEYSKYKGMDVKVINPSMDEIAEVYKDAFLTFVPTKWSEGTSLSAIESIMSGCPVIVSDVGGLGNIVLPGMNGVIVPPTSDAFYNATITLLKQPEIRNTMAKNCKLMGNVFGVKRWRKQLADVLKEMI